VCTHRFPWLIAGKYVKGLRCEAFVGGTPQALDPPRLRATHIAVATPGRARALLADGVEAQRVRVVVLDEADKLLDTNLREQTLYAHTPHAHTTQHRPHTGTHGTHDTRHTRHTLM
jgi:superfamily II DNA/RNA helicase